MMAEYVYGWVDGEPHPFELARDLVKEFSDVLTTVHFHVGGGVAIITMYMGDVVIWCGNRILTVTVNYDRVLEHTVAEILRIVRRYARPIQITVYPSKYTVVIKSCHR